MLNLWLLRGEASPPVDLNDSGLHLSTAEWVADQVDDGSSPIDGWYPYLGLGFPQTHHYQSLPHVLTGVAGVVVGVEDAYHWSLYLLLAGWPIAVWAGARLLGLGRWQAAAAAAVAPWLVSAPGYGYEHSTYVWQGLGLWPQLWAAWLLPITIGLAHRCARGLVAPAWVGLALAATALCHFLTAWLALGLLALLPLLQPRDALRRAGRLGLGLAASAALVAWFVVPMWLDRAGANYAGYDRGTFWYDSFGARRALGWLVSGALFDDGRLPVVTVLAAVGLVVTALRSRDHVGSRVVLLVGGLSLVLFFGRPTLGPLLDLLPYGRDVFFPRMIAGVHLGGILLAGVGLAWLGERVVDLLRDLGPVELASGVAIVAGVVLLAPAVRDIDEILGTGRGFMAAQRADEADEGADVQALLDLVAGQDGRVYAGLSSSWGRTYRVGFVPVYAEALARQVDAVGFLLRVASIGTIVEPMFDESDPTWIAALGVKWMILPADRTPLVPASTVRSVGGHRLWVIRDAPGYAQVVDAGPPVAAGPETLRDVVAASSAAGELTSTRRPVIRWRGAAGEPTAFTARDGEPGRVNVGVVEPDDGRFTFQVDAVRDAYVALAASWHPRWQARVDGERVATAMLAPGVVGAPVRSGRHAVSFEYVPFPHTPWLVAGGLLVFGLVAAVPRFVSRRRLASNGRANDHTHDA